MAPEHEIVPLTLPKLPPELNTAKNRLFTGATRAAFTFEKLPVTVELAPAWAGERTFLAVHGLWGTSKFEWVATVGSVDILAGLLKLPLDRDWWGELPPVMRTAIWEAVLDKTLKRLGKESGEAATISSIDEIAGAELELRPEWIFLDWRVGPDATLLRSAFRFLESHEDIRRLTTLFAALPHPPAAVPEDWPVEAAVELFSEKVELAVLKAAAPGDIIVLSGGGLLAEGRAALRLGRRVLFPVKLEGGRATILEGKMAEENKQGEAARKGKAVDAIEVNLTLELDSRMWQVGELAQVQPGYVFDTGKTLASPVSLKVNGREWGKGEMVDLNGKVGVRLLSLS